MLSKFGLFSISMFAIWLILFIKNVDIPICMGTNVQFVGWQRLMTYGNFIALSSLVMFFVAIDNFLKLRYWLKGSPNNLSVTIKEVYDRNYEYVNTLATIVTLFSVILVPVDSLKDFIIFLIMMSVIIICFMKTNLYYSNPVFAFLGYRLYTVMTCTEKLPKEIIAIYHGNLSADVKKQTYHISDNVYYLI